ncbi:MAG: cytochrome P450 [Chloroflexota bacterium]
MAQYPKPTFLSDMTRNVQFRLDGITFTSDLEQYSQNVIRWKKNAVYLKGYEYNQLILRHPKKFINGVAPSGPSNSYLEKLLTGLVFQNGDTHKEHRSAMLPHFARRSVEKYFDTMVEVTNEVFDSFDHGYQGPLKDALTNLTFEIIFRTLFGTKTDSSDHNLAVNVVDWLQLLTNPLSFLSSGYYFPLLSKSASLYKETQSVINQIQQREDNPGILATLMKHTDMSNDDLIGHVVLLFFAGYETTRSTLYWLMILLSIHPDKAKLAFEDVEDAFGNEPLSFSSLDKLKYLDWFIKEGMRLFPAVPNLERIAATNFEIDGEEFNEGTHITISPYHTHRNADIWDDPLLFSPARWDGLKVEPYTYLPYSLGSRACIGEYFATIEIKVILSIFLRRFSVSLLNDITMINREMRATLYPKETIGFQLGKPNEWSNFSGEITGNFRDMIQLNQVNS